MLVRFTVENFASIRERQELSFVASSLKDPASETVPLGNSGIEILPVAALYGANASGKTNVLKALSFMAAAVENSQARWKPGHQIGRNPFLLDGGSKEKPGALSVDLFLDGIRYEYGFEIGDYRFTREWLHAYPGARKQTWYVRDGDEFRFGKHLAGENKVIRSLTRRDSLFLSAAAQNNHKQLLPVYEWFARRMAFTDIRVRSMNLGKSLTMAMDPARRAALMRMVSAADLGIVDIDVKEERPPPEVRALLEAIVQAGKAVSDLEVGPLPIPDLLPIAEFRHKCSSGSVGLSMEMESAGTISIFALGSDILEALDSGGLLCVDELELSLHPSLSRMIISLFSSTTKNPNHAQLLFSTHSTTLLSERILRRDQIWFTEKDENGATKLYPLTDFKPRKLENLESGYLQGRYGAVPFVAEPDLLGGGERK